MQNNKSVLALLFVILCVGCISDVQEAVVEETTTTTIQQDLELDYKCSDCNVLLLTIETFRSD
ncbi:hypothetical protein ACFLRC_04085, partial [Candidatus Altiarchaeota archaeon]